MSETETKSSSSTRGFWSLIVTQFQNAFSDNALRNLVIFLIVGAGLSAAERDRMILLIGMLFSMPFILFSMAGGFLADRFSKRLVTIGTKLSELPLMLLAMAGLAANSQPALLAAVFLMGVRSALFGGEGLFFARLRGPGKVWIQSLPFSRLAGRMMAAANGGGQNRGEGSVLGGLGDWVGGND